jgi:hypothetical protein
MSAEVVVSESNVTLEVGAGTLIAAPGQPLIQVNGNNVKIEGLGNGQSVFYEPQRYVTPVWVGSPTKAPGPVNFTMTGMTIRGPDPAWRGLLNTSGLALTWVGGGIGNFSGMVNGSYINLGTQLIPWKIATVNSPTSITLAPVSGIGTVTYSSGGSFSGSGTCPAVANGGYGALLTVTVASGSVSGIAVNYPGVDYATLPTTATITSTGTPLGTCSITGGNATITITSTFESNLGVQDGIPYRAWPYSGDVSITGTPATVVTLLNGSSFAGLGAGGSISFGTRGSYVSSDSVQIHSVGSGNTALTLSAAAGTGAQTAVPYGVWWDVSGSDGVVCAGCSGARITGNEFTGIPMVALQLEPATDSVSGFYETSTHFLIAENWCHDNGGECFNTNVSTDGVLADNNASYNGLNGFDVYGPRVEIVGGNYNNNGSGNRPGDSKNGELNGSDNIVADVNMDFGNEMNLSVIGSNQTVYGAHLCGASNAIGGWGFGVQLGYTVPAGGLTFTNNFVCNNPNDGILVGGITSGNISNNHANGNGSYGMLIEYGASNANIHYDGNDFSGNSYAAYADGGSNDSRGCNIVTLGVPCDTISQAFYSLGASAFTDATATDIYHLAYGESLVSQNGAGNGWVPLINLGYGDAAQVGGTAGASVPGASFSTVYSQIIGKENADAFRIYNAATTPLITAHWYNSNNALIIDYCNATGCAGSGGTGTLGGGIMNEIRSDAGSENTLQFTNFPNGASAGYVIGPSTAPSGSCTPNGAWVFSQDGHATFCASGTWTTKI